MANASTYPGWQVRNELAPKFRRAICERFGVIPFPHQLEYWLATEGRNLVRSTPTNDEEPLKVRTHTGDVEVWHSVPRPEGLARVVASLGSFKTGKSFGSALLAASYGIVPAAKIKLIGYEYDMCSPEFEYILDFLLSDQGMQMKYANLQNRPRDGKMVLKLQNGAVIEARSWDRSESLKGKEDDVYLYCEAYQLPGVECYTSFKQNLQLRKGIAIFATTPDKPWVEILHNNGHGDRNFPEWFCTCGTPRSHNPFEFNEHEMSQDDPERGGLMTREQYAISWLGEFGSYIGSVYDHTVGTQLFTPDSHPNLYKDPKGAWDITNLNVPDYYERLGGIDYGRYRSAVNAVADEDGNIFVVAEHPNYHYVANTIENLYDYTLDDYVGSIRDAERIVGGKFTYLGDKNSQWIHELTNSRTYRMSIGFGEPDLDRRTEITRLFMQNKKIFFAPWLKILPQEVAWAEFADKESLTGNNRRRKHKDHTVDCLEHLCAMRPTSSRQRPPRANTIRDLFVHHGPKPRAFDPVVG